VIWRAKGDFDRAIADGSEAIRLAKNPPPNVMTPPNSVVIAAYIHRALAFEAKGDYEHAKADFAATLEPVASDAAGKANQATARVRLSLLTDPGAGGPKEFGALIRARRDARCCRPPRRTCNRQWRLCQRQGAAQSTQ
jgi:hypothetical protein